eukprot:m.38533 g.38533  ORF g.38533 m.38533 type:complete len:91 (+) comp12594_c0_seq8:44-316(+)
MASSVRISKANISTTAIVNVVVATILMFTLPFAGFYGGYQYGRANEYGEKSSNVIGVIGAVVAVQLVIAMFVILAFREGIEEDPKPDKKD